MSNNVCGTSPLHLDNLNQTPDIKRYGKESRIVMIDNKRVYCLYRVSTLGQVEKDDIPMQRQCCREFAAQQGWEIISEKSEKGVSGFKVSAKNRNAIQELQKDALAGKFDILLVFMFDRLGRRDDETPFVVEWFVNHGIEVWSVKEGPQRFESHVDKLTNYIRYWQASGESVKTSIRTKTRLGQIVEEGRFKGGTAPFGYRLVNSGIINKKNHEVSELQIDESESTIVKLIFNLYVNEGYGTLRISNYLRENGIRNRKGECFTNPTIQHMLKNITYTGVMRCGESRSDLMQQLQIIDEHTFERVQQYMVERSNKCKDNRTVPLSTKGQSLLSTNAFCGHCGGRLVLTTNGKRKEIDEDGNEIMVPKARYICYRKTRYHDCDGQTGYYVPKLDGIIEKIVQELFEKVKGKPEFDTVSNQDATYALLESAKETYAKHQQEYNTYKAEVLKSLNGESSFSADILSELLSGSKAAMEAAEREIDRCQRELAGDREANRDSRKNYETILTWVDLYNNASKASKRMIISQLIKAVRVKRDYELEIDFNIAYEQYCTGF